ncbi:uncharacterized protein LOC116608835 [Nematostella vectensis]|uniref:uncharacterized protein LOC116608835 n=1 Tax=Nematostella vectensis TaxID=45351 RepID=UPI0013902073|nr:uncharacterized protein LOC116608835 [Nematostella vectensis]
MASLIESIRPSGLELTDPSDKSSTEEDNKEFGMRVSAISLSDAWRTDRRVIAKFAEYCEPRKNVPFERYRFNKLVQEAGETNDQYRTALRKLAEGCQFANITPDEILRDRFLFGVRDNKVRERLLRETNLTLKKTDEICRASESSTAQMKGVGQADTISAVVFNKKSQRHQVCQQDRVRQLWPNTREWRLPGPWENVQCVWKSYKQTYVISNVSAVTLDDSQLVTLRLESGNSLHFQADTGAQCNVVPLSLYKKATNDIVLRNVKSTKSTISANGGSKLALIGQVIIPVWRDTKKFKLDCKLVDKNDSRPILGRKACLGLNIIQYMDNGAINKPIIGNSTVYAVHSSAIVTIDNIVQQFPNVFADEVGLLDGEYHIKLDGTVSPVQHAPRRVPVALRDQLKAELDKIVEQEIIAPVTAPTLWVSTLVVVPKKNGKLRLCLDPKDLNKATMREHYPLPTIKDVATRLHGAKVFTKLDVRSGFWHINLDNLTSYLTNVQHSIRAFPLEANAFWNTLSS